MNYDYKKIWVKKDDNILEYKEWFIFDFELEGKIKDKVKDFIEKEEYRYSGDYKDLFNNILEEEFYNIETKNNYIPPRIIKLIKDVAKSLNFSKFNDVNHFTFGDDVGGILQEDDENNNTILQREIINYSHILFNPGVIAKIHYEDNSEYYYIYQLSKNHLFSKDKIFYSAFGGHIKYKNELIPYLEKYNIKINDRQSNNSNYDVSLLIPIEYFEDFIKLFHKDILTKEFNLYENIEETIKRELLEELGPVNSSDGINLLTEDEIKKITKI